MGALLGLPPKRPGSTICLHLDEATNLCTIYETRPAMCRVTGMYRENAEACNRLQENQGISKSFRVFV